MTSGYSREQVQKILVNGIKGYQSKKERRMKSNIGGGRLHRTAQESSMGRIKKKLLGKSSWYRSRRKEDGEHTNSQPGKGGTRKNTKLGSSGATLKTRAVIFLEQTPGGELARRVREQLVSLEPTLGYRLRVVERTGRSIQSIFSQTSVWSGVQCGREHCITCNQGGEDIPDCTRRGVVYESICTVCNPSSLNKGELKSQESNHPSLYVGETSRSVQERAAEHWGAAHKEQEKSHMVKHQKLEHPGEKPAFLFKVVSNHKTALGRQIKEAVRIRRRGGAGSILNSKGEFNRCHIPRLIVEPEDEESETRRLAEEQKETKELFESLEEEDVMWRNKKTREQELAVTKRRRRLSEDDATSSLGANRPKKLRYTPLLEDWEEEDDNSGGEQGAETVDEPEGNPVVGGIRLVSTKSSKPTLITDYYSLNKLGSMEPTWDDEDGEGWFIEQTNPFQDYRYERPGRNGGTKSPLGGDRTNQQEGMVDGWEQVLSNGAEAEIWGSQEIVEEWMTKTQFLWDTPTLEEGSWVRVVGNQTETSVGAEAKAKSLTTPAEDSMETEESRVQAQSLTTMVVRTPLAEDG